MNDRWWAGAFLLACAAAWAPLAALAQWNPPNPVVSFDKQPNGVEIRQKNGVLKLEVDAPDLLHITYAPLEAGTVARPSDHVVIKHDWPTATFDVTANEKAITLTTSKLKAVVDRESGALHYMGPDGKQLTTEGYRSLKSIVVNGEKTYHAEVFFPIYGSHEGLYGLGQHQAGVWNYRGETLDLSQENTQIAVPLLVSTNGYGIFWNNPSRSRVNNRFVHSLYISC